ncbi:MAG: N-6 DNA methylase [Candidatus Thorarchaeota archaeon]
MISHSARKDLSNFSPLYTCLTEELYPLVRNLLIEILRHDYCGEKLSLSLKKVLIGEKEVSFSEKRILSLNNVIGALYHDKILIGLLLSQSDKNLSSALENLKYSVYNKKRDKVTGSESFNRLLKTFFRKAGRVSSRFPIMNREGFPLNALDDILLDNKSISWVLSKNLVQFSSGNTESIRHHMMLPYVFESAIAHNDKQAKGQVFTPVLVADFLCRRLIPAKVTRIVDPACGTGIMLLRSLNLLIQRELIPSGITFIGIEKDPILGGIAKSALSYFTSVNFFSINFTIIIADFFDFAQDSPGLNTSSNDETVFLVNPPYTRQELLADDYKERIYERMKADCEYLHLPLTRRNLLGRASIYVYFIIHLTTFLKPGDRLGLIIPNSWLDVRYGQILKTCFLTHYHISFLLNCPLEKLIPEVEVNTIILNLAKIDPDLEWHLKPVKFISISARKDLGNSQEVKSKQVASALIDRQELANTPKWSVFFRQIPIFRGLLRKVNDTLISLGEITSIKRGFTSGANAFFYLPKPGKANSIFRASLDTSNGNLMLHLKDDSIKNEFLNQGFQVKDPMFVIEREYWMNIVTEDDEEFSYEYQHLANNGERWIPNYLIKSPRQIKSYEIQEKDVNHVVLVINSRMGEKLKPGVSEYINWGENWEPVIGQKYPLRPTCRSRRKWFELPLIDPSQFRFLCLMTMNDRFPFFDNPRGFRFDARFYGIRFRNDLPSWILLIYLLVLNSSFSAFQIELLGRNNLGEGGLDIKVYEYSLLKVPKIERIKSYGTMKGHSSLYEMIGNFYGSSPFILSSRKQSQVLKDINDFMASLFGVDVEVITKVHMELQRIVEMRLLKARSVIR